MVMFEGVIVDYIFVMVGFIQSLLS